MVWGDSVRGGPSCPVPGCWETPQPVGVQGVTSVDAENTFNMEIGPGGTVWTFGQGKDGQLGDGSTASSRNPVQVTGLANIVQTDGGDSFAIALDSSGNVWTWGLNEHGMLGDGTTTNSDVPVEVTSLPGPACAVAAGGAHAYALLCPDDAADPGTVWAWGSNQGYALGDGISTGNELMPIGIPGLTGITSIASGDMYGFAETPDGTVSAWGYNRFGMLCDGSTRAARVPTAVPLLDGVSQISGGGNFSTDGLTLALTTAGTVEACGDNADGELGNGTTANSDVPVPVTGPAGITDIAAGGAFGMAEDGSGDVYTWGANEDGQVGNGTTTDALTPVLVLSGAASDGISAGSLHAMALSAPTEVQAGALHSAAAP